LTSFLLMVTLLSSTIGISMYQHICSVSGRVESSMLNDFGCCGSSEDEDGCIAPVSTTAAFEHGCCSLALNYLKTDLISVIKEVTANWIKIPVAELPYNYFTSLLTETKINFLFESDTSPPSGRDILVHKQSFLI
jgi:hypothetical protein